MLYGADPLADFEVDLDRLRLLSEQALRNLRLRAVHAFIVFGDDRKRYLQFLLHVGPRLFVDLSSVLRLAGTEIPHDFSDRIPIVEKELAVDGSILGDLLRLKETPHRLSGSEIESFHRRLFHLLDHTVKWMESRWPNQ